MTWYQGPTLLWYLENVYTGSDRNLIDPRFPVQFVIRPHSNDYHDYRGFAGTVAGGAFRPGDEVLVLPSGITSTISEVDVKEGSIDEATPNMSVTIRLADEIDISRGDMICRPMNTPTVSQDIDAMICWFNERPLQPRGFYAIKHTTRSARALVKDLHYRLDVNSLHRHDPGGKLAMNEMGRVSLRTTVPLMFDEYRRNRQTGSFILIDEATNETVGAGMILGETQ
jgi:bifunctional enzyme CysN/CysC